MSSNKKNFFEELRNNPHIENNLSLIKETIEAQNIKPLPAKKSLLTLLVDLWSSNKFKAGVIGGVSVLALSSILLSVLLPNILGGSPTIDTPIVKTEPIFKGVKILSEDELPPVNNETYLIKESNVKNAFTSLDDLITSPSEIESSISGTIELNSEVYLSLSYSNPDEIEIDSVEISKNGGEYQVYTSDMFYEGSSFTNIIIDVGLMDDVENTYQVGDSLYILDGDSKICEKDGDDTISLSTIEFENYECDKVEEKIEMEKATFEYKLVDSASVLISPKLYLTDGQSLLINEDYEITSENLVFEFDNLKPYTDYEFGLFAYVDKRNGEMMKLTKIAGQKFRTLNYFDTISYSGYSTYISVTIKGLIEGAKIDALTLYDSSENIIKQMDEITFDPNTPFLITELEENATYTLEIVASLNGENPTTAYFEIKTQN